MFVVRAVCASTFDGVDSVERCGGNIQVIVRGLQAVVGLAFDIGDTKTHIDSGGHSRRSKGRVKGEMVGSEFQGMEGEEGSDLHTAPLLPP